MSSQCFVCIFLWVYMLQFICCVYPEQSSKTPASGPFKASITSIKDCRNPSRPYLKNPQILFHAAVTHNRSLSGNITFLKDAKNLKIRVRGSILHNGKWESSYLFNNLDCRGMVLHLVSVTLNVKYDRKNCLYFKGSYSFDNLDVNQLLHFWISKVKYGHILWRSETYTTAGTINCKEYDTMTEPA